MGFLLLVLLQLGHLAVFAFGVFFVSLLSGIITGIGSWFLLMRKHSFRGTQRSELSIAISYLDKKDAGIGNVGRFRFPPPPSQFTFLTATGPYHMDIFLNNIARQISLASERPTSVKAILAMLKAEYEYPLRLLLIQDHEEVLYTGRVFVTSRGVRFREAVFLPS